MSNLRQVRSRKPTAASPRSLAARVALIRRADSPRGKGHLSRVVPGRETPMQTFRAYLLNPAGKIVWADWIEAHDQAEAEALAHKLCKAGTPTVELWKGARLVAELPCGHVAPVG